MAAVADHTARAASQAVAHAADLSQDAQHAGAKAASEAVQRASDRLIQTLGLSGEEGFDLARQSSQNIQAVADCQGVLARGLQDISREWISLAQTNVQKSLVSFGEFSKCRTLQGLLAVQSDLLRGNLERMIAASQRVSALSLQVSEEATQKIKPASAPLHQAA